MLPLSPAEDRSFQLGRPDDQVNQHQLDRALRLPDSDPSFTLETSRPTARDHVARKTIPLPDVEHSFASLGRGWRSDKGRPIPPAIAKPCAEASFFLHDIDMREVARGSVTGATTSTSAEALSSLQVSTELGPDVAPNDTEDTSMTANDNSGGSESHQSQSRSSATRPQSTRAARLLCADRIERQRELLMHMNIRLARLARAGRALMRHRSSPEGASRAYAERLEAVHSQAVQTAQALLEMRQVRTKATPWHTRSGYFLELPLAYYLAHSSLFFGPATKDAGVHGDGDADPYGPDRCRAIKQLTVWLKQATYTPAKGESFDQAILALKARHSGDKLAWLCKDGSTACLLSQLPRARPRPAAAVERPNSTD